MILNKTNLKGIWAGVPLSWDEHYELDETSYRKNISRLVGDGVEGIYINGTAGEFYALSWDDFKHVVEVFLDEADRVLTQVGCCATNTRDVIRMIRYAADRGASGVQLVIPFWYKLSEREVLQFFADVASACPDVSLIHYDNRNTKWNLSAAHYPAIVNVCSNLVGVKYGGELTDIQWMSEELPNLCVFVPENQLASASMLGARGSYGTIPYINPKFTRQYWEAVADADWKTAMQFQGTMIRFFREVEGATDYCGPGIDKLLGVASGYLAGSVRIRKPYISPTSVQVDAVRKAILDRFPFMLAGSE